MIYRLVDELGYEIDRGPKKKILRSCAMNYGSKIVISKLTPVSIVGWQEKIDKTFCLLVNRPDRSTVAFHPELHKIFNLIIGKGEE